MQIVIYIIFSYLLYGAYLILCDFGLSHPDRRQYHNAPMYVFNPSAGAIFFAFLAGPFIRNGLHSFSLPIQIQILSVAKIIIKVGLIGAILYFIVNLF